MDFTFFTGKEDTYIKVFKIINIETKKASYASSKKVKK
jgi:hypothetical protein